MDRRTQARRFRKLADVIEVSETYDQEFWWNQDGGGEDGCGTPACIAGHAVVLAGKTKEMLAEGWYSLTASLAAEWLGIEYWFREELFSDFPHHSWPEPFAAEWEDSYRLKTAPGRRNRQRKIAAAYLRHLADSGVPEDDG